MKSRNPIARNTWKFNKPKVYKAKKGKGSFKRDKNTRSLFSNSDLRLAG
jgi:stalled ribosome alternative rescue factor ArfA